MKAPLLPSRSRWRSLWAQKQRRRGLLQFQSRRCPHVCQVVFAIGVDRKVTGGDDGPALPCLSSQIADLRCESLLGRKDLRPCEEIGESSEIMSARQAWHSQQFKAKFWRLAGAIGSISTMGSTFAKPHTLHYMPSRSFHMACNCICRPLRVLRFDACYQLTMFAKHIGLPAKGGREPAADRP